VAGPAGLAGRAMVMAYRAAGGLRLRRHVDRLRHAGGQDGSVATQNRRGRRNCAGTGVTARAAGQEDVRAISASGRGHGAVRPVHAGGARDVGLHGRRVRRGRQAGQAAATISMQERVQRTQVDRLRLRRSSVLDSIRLSSVTSRTIVSHRPASRMTHRTAVDLGDERRCARPADQWQLRSPRGVWCGAVVYRVLQSASARPD